MLGNCTATVAIQFFEGKVGHTMIFGTTGQGMSGLLYPSLPHRHLKERLLRVWPSLMDMPLSDQAFVVGLAMTCNLETRPVAKDEVVACLRAAAVDPEPTLPNGFDRTGAPAKLEAMLHESAAIWSSPATK